MTTSNDSLGFFILEASDCLERLDGILATAGPGGPDAAEFARYARTLRGAAVMHRVAGMIDLAGAVERAGRTLRDGRLRWSPPLAAALTAAVDDLKILLHNLRIWGPNEEARAARRLADLARFAPAPESATDGAGAGANRSDRSRTAESSLAFVAREAMETATALDALASVSPGGAGQAEAVEIALGHVRTLRGVAAVHDIPPVPDVLDSVERAARTLGLADVPATAAQGALFSAAAALLRRTASDLRAVGRSEPGTPEERRFLVAREALVATADDADRIMPISELFYEDGSDGVVSRAINPPTTSGERFYLEVVSLAEHARALVREAQGAGPGPLPERAVLELRGALGAIRSAAHSFGERDVSDFIATFTDGPPIFDFLTLNTLDQLLALLADPAGSAGDLAQRVGQLARDRAIDAGIGVGLGAIGGGAGLTGTAGPRSRAAAAAAAGQGASRPPAGGPGRPGATAAAGGSARGAGLERGGPSRAGKGPRTPAGSELRALLADGIAGISSLDDVPLIDQPAGPTRRPASATHIAPAPGGPEGAAEAGRAPAAGAGRAAATGAATGASTGTGPAPDADGLVPIEALLFRGPAALARARAIRDALRGERMPHPEALAELYDLLDLAASG